MSSIEDGFALVQDATDEAAPATSAVAAPMDDSQWEGDLQYTSMYLDRKEEVEGENQRYIEAHPALRQMCSDFLVHLMHRKPDDVIGEAKGFFTQYSQGTQ
jgi:hypothetical protein